MCARTQSTYERYVVAFFTVSSPTRSRATPAVLRLGSLAIPLRRSKSSPAISPTCPAEELSFWMSDWIDSLPGVERCGDFVDPLDGGFDGCDRPGDGGERIELRRIDGFDPGLDVRQFCFRALKFREACIPLLRGGECPGLQRVKVLQRMDVQRLHETVRVQMQARDSRQRGRRRLLTCTIAGRPGPGR